MARQENNPTQAWVNFAATGAIADYLRYRALENRANAPAGTSGGQHADSHTARSPNQRKRPPDHTAF